MKIAPLFLSIAIVAGVFSSCRNLDELVSFNLETNDSILWIGIPDTVLTDTFLNNEGFIITSREFAFSDYPKFASNKTTPGQIEDVQAFNFSISLDDDSVTNYSFCRDLKITLISATNSFPDIDIYENPLPLPTESSFTAEIMGNSSDFLAAIQKDDYRFKTQFILQGPVPDTIRMNYSMSFRLKGNPND
ncbi:MAG: hypothetical protein WED33_13185 [Bacteroidia bacterium]